MDTADNEESTYSRDDALAEMLGLSELCVKDEVAEDVVQDGSNDSGLPCLLRLPKADLQRRFFPESALERIRERYSSSGFAFVPDSLNVAPIFMRRITNELVYDHSVSSDKTYENIASISSKEGIGSVMKTRTLTRLENFVNHHLEWRHLCDYVDRLLGCIFDDEYVLFKEKLNLKPVGGAGFAPHLDAPSLQLAIKADRDSGMESSPPMDDFVTACIAIDDMTVSNGCLQVSPGLYTAATAVPCVAPTDDNPDGGGRLGAIEADVVNRLEWQALLCRAGQILLFDGWLPHRSAANHSCFARRAVFLTYHPARYGNWHDAYYHTMAARRSDYRHKIGWHQRQQDEQNDLDALATIPKI